MNRWHTIGNEIFNPDGELHMVCHSRDLAKGLAQRLNDEMMEGRKQKCVWVGPPTVRGRSFDTIFVSFLDENCYNSLMENKRKVLT